MLKKLATIALGLFFPPVCEACGGLVPPDLSAEGVCAACQATIRPIGPPHCLTCGRTLRQAPVRHCGECERDWGGRGQKGPHYDRAYACVYYRDQTKELLHAYKFGGRHALKNYFVKLMGSFFEEHLNDERFDGVVAVPLDKKKLRSRGFNQAALLSAALAKRLGIPDVSRRLRRDRSQAPQSLLSKAERQSMIRGCFSVNPGHGLGGKNMLLVDDILTTGRTASECSRVLKAAGARRVTVLAFARGD